jgi:hypothetical protein
VTRTLAAPGKPELYHLAQDPYEQHDLAEAHPEKLAQMQAELANWFEEVNRERRQLPEVWRG